MTASSSSASKRRTSEYDQQLSAYQLGSVVRTDDLAIYYAATYSHSATPLQVALLRRTDPISLVRFRLAAAVGMRVSHPNILPVLVAGRDAEYGDYMVVAAHDAQPLDVILRQGSLAFVDAVQIFGQIALAVDELHDQQVIHRDLQPQSILVSDDLHVYVTGFGFADCAESRDFKGFDDRDYTNAYYPATMSLAGATSAASDDYHAMGMMLYQMLTGGMTPVLPLGVLANVDAELAQADRVIRRLMSATSTQRYTSAVQAVQALKQQMPTAATERHSQLVEPSSDQWDPLAEWLENPLEVLLTSEIDADFLARSQVRANAIHRVDAVRRIIERWSRQGTFRRQTFGQLMRPSQILSSNFYMYELKVHYEKRSEPHTNRKVHRGGHVVPQVAVDDVWDVVVNAPDRFVDVPSVPVRIPGSQQMVKCDECGGSGKLVCGECSGTGTIDRRQRTRNADGTIEEITHNDTCRGCRGYGRVNCRVCEGNGQLLEEQFFHWARFGKRFFNEDDATGLHLRTIESQSQQVFREDIDLHDPRWRQVAPLRELVEEGIREEGTAVRPIAAELIIRSTPVTEVDYVYAGRAYTLTIVGFPNVVRGNWTLYDVERIIIYVTAAVVFMAVVVMVVVMRSSAT
jgi:serine/threonine protein kinase